MMSKLQFDPNQIQWYDGMVLSCHHFQQVDLRNYHVMRYLNLHIGQYCWGIINIEFDMLSISNSIVKVTKLECIMPDYSILDLPSYSDKSIEIDLSNQPDVREPFLLYCILSPDHILYSQEMSKNRYKSMQAESVVDANTGDNRENIIRLAPNIVLSSSKPPTNHISIPIARLAFENRQLTLLSYDPPTPNLRQAHQTMRILLEVIEQLNSKLDQAKSKLKISGNSYDFDIYGKLILDRIWPLKVQLATEIVNPFDIYLSCIQLCSSLAQIADQTTPPLHEKYDHLDIYRSFSVLVEFLHQKIRTINQNYCSDLNKFLLNVAKNQFHITLPARESRKLKILMQFKMEIDYKIWLSNAIIASHNLIDELKLERLLGCDREVLNASQIQDNLRLITVMIILNPYYIKSNILYIANQIDADNAPKAIYLLDD